MGRKDTKLRTVVPMPQEEVAEEVPSPVQLEITTNLRWAQDVRALSLYDTFACIADFCDEFAILALRATNQTMHRFASTNALWARLLHRDFSVSSGRKATTLMLKYAKRWESEYGTMLRHIKCLKAATTFAQVRTADEQVARTLGGRWPLTAMTRRTRVTRRVVWEFYSGRHKAGGLLLQVLIVAAAHSVCLANPAPAFFGHNACYLFVIPLCCVPMLARHDHRTGVSIAHGLRWRIASIAASSLASGLWMLITIPSALAAVSFTAHAARNMGFAKS